MHARPPAGLRRRRHLPIALLTALVAAVGATTAGAAEPTWQPPEQVQFNGVDAVALAPDGVGLVFGYASAAVRLAVRSPAARSAHRS